MLYNADTGTLRGTAAGGVARAGTASACELGDLSLGLRNCGPSLLQLVLKIAVHRSDDDSSLIRKFEKNWVRVDR